MIGVVCVLVVQGLLVTGFPAGHGEINEGTTSIAADVPSLAPVPAESTAEFNNTVPASDAVTSSGSHENQHENIPKTSTVTLEKGENEKTNISDTLINEPTKVNSVVAEEEDKINQTLAIIDKIVDSELEKVDKIQTQPSSKSTNNTDKVDSAIPDLMELQLNIQSELLNIKDFIESELETTRELIRSAVLENKDVTEMKPLEKERLPNMTQTKSLVESKENKYLGNPTAVKSEFEPFSVKEEEIEEKLDQMNEFIENELAKIDAFIESELAMTEALIKREVDKVNAFVESKFPSDSVDPELDYQYQESDVEPELAIDLPVRGFVEFNGIAPASGKTMIFGSTGYTPILPNLEENAEEGVTEDLVTEMAATPVAKEVMFTSRVPVYGRTMIFGNTGFLHPNLAPLKNLNSTPPKVTKEFPKAIPISVESVPVISRNAESKPETTNCPEFSRNFPMISRFSPDFPETVIMDSTKNYERLMEDDEINDDELDHFDGYTYPVYGEAFFEGKAPAFGSVRITGHC